MLEETPSPAPRRSPVVVALAVAVVVALLLGLVLVFVGDEGAGDGDTVTAPDTTDTTEATDGSTTTTTTAGEVGGGSADAELDAVVAELSAFVEQVRGLAFKRPVTVELAADDDFRARLLDDLDEDRDEIERSERVLEALRLIPADTDLYAVLESLLGAGVVGFYDPESEELVVRGTELTPYVRSTLVHELTHALDDQHFELDRPELEDVTDERAYAFSGLYEGNASFVEDEWVASLGADEQAEVRRGEQEAGAALATGRFPEYLVASLAFPYVFGPQLVDALRGAGGQQRVNEAFRQPPTTTEQIIDPERYLAGEGARPVDRPPAEGDVIDEGAVGQWDLYLLLSSELGGRRAAEASDGWGGDGYVAWADGDRSCVRATFVMDTVTDLGELASALEDWAAAHGDATLVGGDDRVTVTACG